MKILLGSDHRGFELKGQIKQLLESMGYEVNDVNDQPLNPEDDYPMIVSKLIPKFLAEKMEDRKAILICGSGQGMVIAANRFKGIRASLCWNEAGAISSRNDDDSNILCLSADQTSHEDASKIITSWLNTKFAAAPRYIRRIKEIDELV